MVVLGYLCGAVALFWGGYTVGALVTLDRHGKATLAGAG
jgi:hypothetical protein